MNVFEQFNDFNSFGGFYFSPENEQIDNLFNSSDLFDSINQEKEEDNINNFSKIDIIKKNTMPTSNQNSIKDNIKSDYDFNENQNKSLNLSGNDTTKYKFKTEQRILGRKRQNSNEVGKHGKESGDNIIRKIKSRLLNYLRIFINLFIYGIYHGNIGEGKYKKEILKINQEQIINDKNNKKFIKKTLKEIFSYKLSGKYSNFGSDHNIKIIEILLNESDNEKKEKFQNLFSLTFLECLNHFSGIKLLPILKGMKSLNDFCKIFENDKTYLNSFKHYCLNFEQIIMNKKSRNRTKKKS